MALVRPVGLSFRRFHAVARAVKGGGTEDSWLVHVDVVQVGPAAVSTQVGTFAAPLVGPFPAVSADEYR